jgi:DNA-binding response OmpR family regulator
MAASRVLVVDDNHEVRRMVTASIKTLGADLDVLDVPSAEEALFISSSLPLDLVVLDFRLPGMSGLEMVDRLRKHKPETKIILVTGVEDTATRKQISEAGVAAFFFKPIEIATFLDAVKRCLWSDQNVLSLPATRILNSGEPSISGKPSVSGGPSASGGPSVSRAKPVIMQGFQPTLDERMTALKQQVRAISVLLVNETGRVLEVAGNPSQITSSSVLLPALMEAFHASQKVSDALGKSSIESLHYFTDARQRIYLAPVNPSNALLVVTTGYFEPDKLGMLDRAIHLAVHDLQDIQERTREQESLKPDVDEVEHSDLPTEIIVDPETLARVADMFSRAPKGGGKEEADGFWETLGENSQLDNASGKDVLSYDQARDMGLAPDEDKQP